MLESSHDSYDYDLLVIGGGSGGVRGARIAASLGAKVAIIEDTYWGGTCVNVGCVPKKIYHYLASCIDEINISKALGFDVDVKGLDWGQFFFNKNKEIARLQGVYQKMLSNANVEIINGRGVLTDKHTVSVSGNHLTAKHILLAVGGTPVTPNIAGAEFAMNSDELFDMSVLPQSMLVVGGGYIGCELASTFHKLGVDIDLVVRSQLLKAFDSDVVAFVEDEMRHEGLSIIKGITPVEITRGDNEYLARFSDGTEKVYEKVLFAMGRKPRFDGLGLENTSVAVMENGLIRVNGEYQTDEPSIFAVGDIVPGHDLTPVALAQGMYVARHLFGEEAFVAPDLERVATTVFTHPQLASVGLSEAQLKSQGVAYKVFESSFRLLKTRITDYELKMYIKMLVNAQTDEIVGIHMAGPEVGEAMQGFAVCVQARLTKHQFDQTVGIHPTYAEELVTMREPTRVEV